MPVLENPALNALAALIGEQFILAQIFIRRMGKGYELRHAEDQAKPESELPLFAPNDARSLAQFTAKGAFRPLKSAPNLRRGWRILAPDLPALGLVLDQLYPGALADWSASQSRVPPVTNYREYAGRQTGIYRITARLDDGQAARVIRACCHAQFCLKRRLWSVSGLEAETGLEKSVIPCLEPCAVFLEFARKAMRLEQGDKASASLPVEDWQSIAAALEMAARNPEPAVREGDVANGQNPRRLQLVRERLQPLLNGLASGASEA